MRSFQLMTLCLPALASAAAQSFGAGGFSVYASDSPFLSLDDSIPGYPMNFYFRTQDGYAYAYNNDGQGGVLLKKPAGSTAAYVAAPGDCVSNTCQLIFQSDGNLVFYWNGGVVWDAQTSGRGATIQFNAVAPHCSIFDASGQLIYYGDMPGPPTGGPPPGCPGSDC